MNPNNVTRMLDSLRIPYTVYDLPREKIGAMEAAQILGVSPEVVYKTIVVTREKPGKPILAVIAGPEEVDLKSLAKALGEKKVTLATEREAERLTGLQAGGISPLALIHKGFQIVLDVSAELHPEILISGGQRGLDIRLPVTSLVSLTNAMLAPISH
jgi:Cys-tRNA(Pro)/Cys-tRNA(Cys) deacylase